MLDSDKKFAGMKIEKLLFIGPDCRHVIGRLKDSGQACQIIKPKLGRSVDVIVRQSRQLFAACMTLDVASDMLLDFRKRTEEGGVIVTMVGDELVVVHLWLAAKKDGHLDHIVLPCGRRWLMRRQHT